MSPQRTDSNRPKDIPRCLGVPACRTATCDPPNLRQAQGNTPSRAIKTSHRNGYDIAFTLGRTNVHAPALNIPQLGPRWVSAALTLLLVFMLFTMWTASPFTVKAAKCVGNQRLGAAEINAMLGMVGQPIFKAVPAQIEANLHTAYSDLASVKVQRGLSQPHHRRRDRTDACPGLVSEWSCDMD